MDSYSNSQLAPAQDVSPTLPESSSRPAKRVALYALAGSALGAGIVLFSLLSLRSSEPPAVSYANWKTDGTYIYYKGSLIAGSDAKTFTALNERFAEDKNWIYGENQPLFIIDRETFQVISGYYARDKERIYFGSTPIPVADLPTFQIIEVNPSFGSFAKDSQFVYIGAQVLTGADPATFIPITNTLYAKDKNGFYLGSEFLGQGMTTFMGQHYTGLGEKIFYQGAEINPPADPGTFRELSPYIGLDSQRVYFQHSQIIGADPATFMLMTYASSTSLEASYSKDKNAVYESGKSIDGVDPQTVQLLSEYYFKDAQNAYFFTEKIAEADLETFHVVGDVLSAYARDKDHVWARAMPLSVDYPEDFRDLGNGYGTDGATVYYYDRILPRADSQTFKHLFQYYAADSRSVYYADGLLSSEARNFRLLASGYAKDSSNVYFGNRLVDSADPTSFTVFYDYYAKDNDHVFYIDKPIIGADPKSFKYDYLDLERGVIFKDNNSKYLNGERI